MTPPPSVRAAVVPWVLGSTLVAVVVLVVVLVAGGGAPRAAPGGLPDAGPVVGWALPVVRLLVDLTGIVTVGLMLAASGVLHTESTAASAARAAASWCAAGWAVLAVLQAWVQVAELQAMPLTDLATLASALGQFPEPRAALIQAALAAAVAWLAWPGPSAGRPSSPRPGSRRLGSGATLGLGLAVAAFVPQGLVGHAVTGNRLIGSASLIVHVLAAALWVGGLAALGWLALRGRGPLVEAVPHFSRLALGCVVAVAVSGVVNATVRIATLEALFGTAYGLVVMAKAAALVVLAGFGWMHRQRTVDRLRSPDRGMGGSTDRPTGGSVGGQRDVSGGVLVFLGLASVELAVMAMTVALAVGLSHTPTPTATPDGPAATSPTR